MPTPKKETFSYAWLISTPGSAAAQRILEEADDVELGIDGAALEQRFFVSDDERFVFRGASNGESLGVGGGMNDGFDDAGKIGDGAFFGDFGEEENGGFVGEDGVAEIFENGEFDAGGGELAAPGFVGLQEDEFAIFQGFFQFGEEIGGIGANANGGEFFIGVGFKNLQGEVGGGADRGETEREFFADGLGGVEGELFPRLFGADGGGDFGG